VAADAASSQQNATSVRMGFLRGKQQRFQIFGAMLVPRGARKKSQPGAPRSSESEKASHLRRDQILDFHAVAVFDDLGDPLPVALRMVALVAENADRA
jgi:hypothetical protein